MHDIQKVCCKTQKVKKKKKKAHLTKRGPPERAYIYSVNEVGKKTNPRTTLEENHLTSTVQAKEEIIERHRLDIVLFYDFVFY